MLTCLLQLLLIVIPSRDIVAVVPMPESKLDIQERHDGDVTVLILTGQITLVDGDLLFRKKVHDLLDQGRTKIVVDIGSVTYIDSAGVGMMAGKLKTVREKGGDLKLARISSKSQRLLGMMKLLLAFETFEDEAAAIKSYAWKG
jgi:anti-sigma B factor antagonist